MGGVCLVRETSAGGALLVGRAAKKKAAVQKDKKAHNYRLRDSNPGIHLSLRLVCKAFHSRGRRYAGREKVFFFTPFPLRRTRSTPQINSEG